MLACRAPLRMARVVVLQPTSCSRTECSSRSLGSGASLPHHCKPTSSLQARKESLEKDCGSLDEAAAEDPEAAAAADAEDG